MKDQFTLTASDRVLTYCEQIANVMVQKFGIRPEEAVGRINEAWGHRPFWSEELMFHETPEYWAHDIYYGHESLWWQTTAGLRPVPFPSKQ